MKRLFQKNKLFLILICIILIIVVFVFAFRMYRKNKVNILDRTAFNDLTSSITAVEDQGGFASQSELKDFITGWADDNGLDYSVDKYDNIIFNTSAVERKKSVSPSVICVSYNYETAIANAELLASAAMIAKTDLDSSRKTVIFFNDEQNLGKGCRGISKKYFNGKSKVIYMDYGSSSYLSTSSFARSLSTITINANREKVTCDTAVKVHITGITSDEITTGISKHPDPVSVLSALLTRLKSKSTIFQLADFHLESNGMMYPVSMDATFVLNSYAVGSFTKYIDKRIKAWEKSYSDDYPELSFTYEVIDDPEQLPEWAYTDPTATRLANVLYTVKSGSYKYSAEDNLPDGREEGDTYGVNLPISLALEDGSIRLDLLTQAYDEDFISQINSDNEAAAELFKCKYSTTKTISRFNNEQSSLSHTLHQTFDKVNIIIGKNSVLEDESDNYFTPCSYLASKNTDADIIHLRLNPRNAATLTNTIMCYIETKGNLFSL